MQFLQGVVLNQFLSAYVEDLGPSQLQTSLWHGTVKLGRLRLKKNALEKLDFPLRIFASHVEDISINIPWSIVYTDCPLIVDIKDVYIIAGPASAVKYDAETEHKEQREAKEKQLKYVDKAKEKDEVKKDKTEEALGFVEKWALHIVRNLRVKVRNIHIQYEDSVSNPASPLSFGVSLDSVTIENINSACGSKGTSDTSLIYKLLQLGSLGIYRDSNGTIFGPQPPENWKEIFSTRIALSKTTENFQYLVKPISPSAKLSLSTKPGRNLRIPLAQVSLNLKDLEVSLSKWQYQDIMNFIESLGRLAISKKHKKYRPEKSIKEDKREWWKYAFNAELVDIKRRTQAWSWTHIKAHRDTCRKYTKAYQEKLLAKSVSPELTKLIQDLEDQLDVLNITICRQLTENELQRKKKVEPENIGWWAWIWGAKPAPAASDATKGGLLNVASEKEKLYKAIGHAKDSKLPDYPKEYVAHNLILELEKMSVQIQNENANIAHFVTMGITADVKHSPSSRNLSVSAKIKRIGMTGLSCSPQRKPPVIIELQGEKEPPTHINFEINPLNSQANYRFSATLSPILVFSDTATTDAMTEMFLLPLCYKWFVNNSYSFGMPYDKQELWQFVQKFRKKELTTSIEM